MTENGAELEALDNSWPKKTIVEHAPGRWMVLADHDKQLEFPPNLNMTWISDQLTGSQWKIIHSEGIKMNPQLILSMYRDAKKGLSKRAILARHGYPPAKWSEWQRRADDGQEPYYLWSQCMFYAASQVEEDVLKNVRLQATGDFKAAKWLLEHINRDEYGPTPKEQTVNIHGDVNASQTTTNHAETSVNYMSDDKALEIARLLKTFNVVPELEAPVEAEVVEDE